MSSKQTLWYFEKEISREKQSEANIRVNDTYGRLYAEVERLMRFCLRKLEFSVPQPSFAKFLGEATDDPTSMMMNIEGFLEALRGYEIISKKDRDFLVESVPKEFESMLMQNKKLLKMLKLENLQHDERLQTSFEVLSFVIGELDKSAKSDHQYKPQLIPFNLSEQILSETQRNEYCDDRLRNDQVGILSMVNQVQAMDEQMTKQVQRLAKDEKNQKATFAPLIDTYNYAGDHQLDPSRNRPYEHQEYAGGSNPTTYSKTYNGESYSGYPPQTNAGYPSKSYQNRYSDSGHQNSSTKWPINY
jgi:hypothetical protein